MLKLFLYSISIILLLFNCKPQEEILTTDSVDLIFKNDTNKLAKEIIFDTVLAGKKDLFIRPSVSKRLKIINPSTKAIKTNITLMDAQNSSYQLYVNGVKFTQMKDFFIRGNDSIYVLIQVTPSLSNATLPFLVVDSIQFSTNNITQYVKLTSWGLDAIYHKNTIITSNTIWDSTRVHFLFNTVKVATGATLTIQKGTKIYGNKNTFLDIEGSLHILGDTGKNEKVQFLGERLEKKWRNVSGQWGGIILREKSQNNIITNAEIKNGTTGISVGNKENNTHLPDLKITNSVIKNMTNSAISAWHAAIEGWNNVAYNCVNQLISIENGGIYKFYNNTWVGSELIFNSTKPCVYISDGINATNHQKIDLDLKNNIIWGDKKVEFELKKYDNNNWQTNLQNNVIKTDENIYSNNNGNIISSDKEAIMFTAFNYDSKSGIYTVDLKIKKESIATEKGVNIPFIRFDIANKSRPIVFDIGAYQH